MGVEPTASLCLKQRGLPVAYRAVLSSGAQDGSRTRKRPAPANARPSRAALPDGVPGPAIGGLSLHYRDRPHSQLGRRHGCRRQTPAMPERKPWDLNPQRFDPHLFSRQAPHPAGWLPNLRLTVERSAAAGPNRPWRSCGGRNRTCVTAVNSRLPVPAQDPPHANRAFASGAVASQHTIASRSGMFVPQTDVLPQSEGREWNVLGRPPSASVRPHRSAASVACVRNDAPCFNGRRAGLSDVLNAIDGRLFIADGHQAIFSFVLVAQTVSRLLRIHRREWKNAQRESNPHFRHGKAVGCRYIMGARVHIELSKIERAPGGTRTHVAAVRERNLRR